MQTQTQIQIQTDFQNVEDSLQGLLVGCHEWIVCGRVGRLAGTRVL